jgi:hypothetical protein
MSSEDIINELKEIRDAEARTWEADILKRTVVKLLAIEKKATYGVVTGKNKKMAAIIDSEVSEYRNGLNEN